MATAVLDLEFSDLPPEITGLSGYDRAFILIRLRGQPVGEAWLPVVGGRLGGVQLREALSEAADWVLWQSLRHDYLGWKAAPALNASSATVTVAVCTRDRPDELRRCLDALMRLPDEGQEFLVVDSCSEGQETRRVVESYPQVRYVREQRPGLNIARNRALREAQHEVVAFTDDDAIPDPEWLRALRRHFSEPQVLCVTGLTMPLELETEAQEWFQRYSPFGRGFRRVVFDSRQIDPLAAARVGAGANMALRRTVLSHVGPFDEALDAGTPTHSGGDTEMFSRILGAGYRIVYEPAALSWHRHRRTWPELRRVLYGYGVGTYAFWTRQLLVEKNLAVLRIALGWFVRDQLPGLIRSLLRQPGSIPLDLRLAELRGCLAGPSAYFASYKQQTSKKNSLEPPMEDARLSKDEPPKALTLRQTVGKIKLPQDMPFVSVIIPTHNRCPVLRQTLDALHHQSYPLEKMEVLVVADGCFDGTVQILHGYQAPYVLHLIEQTNLGPAMARNQGAAHAKGQLLIFLDDDIEAAPQLIEAHVRTHLRQPKQVVIGYLPPRVQGQSKYLRVGLQEWWEAKFETLCQPGYRYRYSDLLSGNFSLEAERFAQLGGFDGTFWCHEDYELGMRLLKAGTTFSFVPDALGYHHETASIERSLRRKYQEGKADVLLGRNHPELRSTLLMALLDTYALLPSRILRVLAFRWPVVGDPLVARLRQMLGLVERMQLRRLWQRILDGLFAYWYWRGVALELGTLQALADFLQESEDRPSEGQAEIEIDLSEGLEAAEQRLDHERPIAVRIRVRKQTIGHIPQEPGAEPLRGAHLRPILATSLAPKLLIAFAMAGGGSEFSQLLASQIPERVSVKETLSESSEIIYAKESASD